MFQINQKVVCITDEWGPAYSGTPLPKKGSIYTVAAIRVLFGKEFIMLDEFREFETSFGYAKPWYLAMNFRPVQERTTDISIFKAMLNPAKLSEKV